MRPYHDRNVRNPNLVCTFVTYVQLDQRVCKYRKKKVRMLVLFLDRLPSWAICWIRFSQMILESKTVTIFRRSDESDLLILTSVCEDRFSSNIKFAFPRFKIAEKFHHKKNGFKVQHIDKALTKANWQVFYKIYLEEMFYRFFFFYSNSVFMFHMLKFFNKLWTNRWSLKILTPPRLLPRWCLKIALTVQAICQGSIIKELFKH